MDVRLRSDDGGVLRVELIGRVAHDPSVPEAQAFEQHLGNDGYSRNVLLSLAEVLSIDSVRLGWLISVHKRFCKAGGRLILHSVRPEVKEILETARFEFVFHMAEDDKAALNMLQEGS